MPLYDFKCSNGHKFEKMVPLAYFDSPVLCTCGVEAKRQLSTPRFSVDSTDYTCPVTGDYISSKYQHEDNLRRHNCRVLETGEKELTIQNRKAADDALDKSIEDTVEKTIEAMPSEKRERLYNELRHSDIEVVRT